MQRLTPGGPPTFSAGTWNNFVDAAEWYKLRKALGDSQNRKHSTFETDIIQIENNTGADRLDGEVVEIDDDTPILDEVDNSHLWLRGITTTGAKGYGILRQPVLKGKLGPCQVQGVCKALVHITDLNHRTAKITPSSHTLVSSENGPVFILYKPSGALSQVSSENVRECVVAINQPMQVFLAESQLTANMCTAADAVLDPNEFVGFRFGQYTLNPVELPEEASNAAFYGHAGQTGDKVLLLFNDHPADGEPKWIVVDVAKKEETLVTDFTIDWEECCYTKSTRKCSVESCEDEVVGDPVCQAS